MAPWLQEHLANKGRPDEAEQMVRENLPIAPWEWGQPPGGFMLSAGFVSGGALKWPWRESKGVAAHEYREQSSKELGWVFIRCCGCWDIPRWKVEAEQGLWSGLCKATLGAEVLAVCSPRDGVGAPFVWLQPL